MNDSSKRHTIPSPAMNYRKFIGAAYTQNQAFSSNSQHLPASTRQRLDQRRDKKPLLYKVYFHETYHMKLVHAIRLMHEGTVL